jgi:hypothetical protein
MIAAGGLRTARLAEHNPPPSAETGHMAATRAKPGDNDHHERRQVPRHWPRQPDHAFNPQAIVLGGG